MLSWVKAAQWAGYRVLDFFELEGDEQSFLVAAYETVMQEESVEMQEGTK